MFNLFKFADTVACYHCGDRVSVSRAVPLEFNGKQRDLCCHGCEAVLMMIEKNGMTAAYLSEKSVPHSL